MSIRDYGQACSVARFLDQLGSRWTLLIVRDLLVEQRRFKDLLASAPAMGPNLLTSRLRELTDVGVIEKVGSAYALTDVGRDLEPVVLSMARWGLRHLALDQDGPGKTRPDLLVVAFRAAFDPNSAAGISECYEFHVDNVTFYAAIRDGSLTTGLGTAEDPALVLTASSQTFDLIGSGTLDIDTAESDGLLFVSGSRAAFGRFLAIFGGQS